MNRKILNVLLSLTILTYGQSSAQRQQPPPGGKAKDFKAFLQKKSTLPNGLRNSLVSYGTSPKVTISLIIATGKNYESETETGLAALTGEMIKQGSVSTDFKTMSSKVAGMGGTIEVNVYKESMEVSGSVLSEFAPDFIKLVAELVMKPSLPSADLERLKDNLRRELAVDKTVSLNLANEQFSKAIFGNHPFGRTFATEEMINGFTIDQVKSFYQKNFGAKRSVLYVVGMFNEPAVTAAIKNAFSSWKPGPANFVALPEKKPGSDTILVDRKDSKQTTLIIGLPAVAVTDKDYIGLYVTDALLGGAFGSRITRNIREDKGYSYSPYSYIASRKGISVWSQVAEVTSEHTADALVEIQKEIIRLRSEPPSSDELKGIQNYLSGLFVLQNSSPRGIIAQLDFLQKHGLPDSYLTSFISSINSITPERVTEIAKRHLDPSKMTVVMVGDKEAINKQLENKLPKKAF